MTVDRREIQARYEALELEIEAQVVERHRKPLDNRPEEPAPQQGRDQLERAGQAMGLVGRISGEQLVPAVARERDGRRAAREAREQVGGEERRVAERLVEELGQTRDEVEGRARIQDLFLMVGVEGARDATRVRGL